MIYVLFGPPGVGKTYIGQLLSNKLGLHFYDADLLIDDELKFLLRNGKYTQEMRDKFVQKLILTTEHLLSEKNEDLLIAEAFTKESNRFNFYRHFDEQVCYIMVRASKQLAKKRVAERLEKGEHVVDDFVFEFVWEEFESPSIRHRILNNEGKNESGLLQDFQNIVKWCEKEVK